MRCAICCLLVCLNLHGSAVNSNPFFLFPLHSTLNTFQNPSTQSSLLSTYDTMRYALCALRSLGVEGARMEELLDGERPAPIDVALSIEKLQCACYRRAVCL